MTYQSNLPELPPEMQPLFRLKHRKNINKWTTRAAQIQRQKKLSRKRNKLSRQARRKNK